MALQKAGVKYWLVASTVFIAMVFSALPIPQWAYLFWPKWVLLVVIYWCLALPEKLNVKFAWTVGILVDLLQGSLLGQHALLYALCAYLTTYFYQRLRLHPPHQQMFFIALLVLLHEAIVLWINSLVYSLWIDWRSLLTVAGSMLVWPWIFAVLRHLRRGSYAVARG